MPTETPSNTAQPSDNVKVAKISAVQAVVVALVAGMAGIASTAGLRYVEHSNELARKDAEIQALKTKSEGEVVALTEKLNQSQAVSALLRVTTSLTQEQCYERLLVATESALPGASNLSGSLHEPTDVGSRTMRGAYDIRILCDPAAKIAIVSVAGSSSKTDVDRVAKIIVAALK